MRPLSFSRSPRIAVTLLPTKVPVEPVLATAARCAALAFVVGAGRMVRGRRVSAVRSGEGADGVPTRCAGAAGSSASRDGHSSEQPAARRPHAKGKTNLLILLILGCHPANSLLFLTSILLRIHAVFLILSTKTAFYRGFPTNLTVIHVKIRSPPIIKLF